MKLSHLFAAAALVLGAACSSLDNPLADVPIFKTGHDARVYNVQTGEYEWPAGATPRPRSASSRASRVASEPPAPAAAPTDGRGFDPMKGEFAEPQPGR